MNKKAISKKAFSLCIILSMMVLMVFSTTVLAEGETPPAEETPGEEKAAPVEVELDAEPTLGPSEEPPQEEPAPAEVELYPEPTPEPAGEAVQEIADEAPAEEADEAPVEEEAAETPVEESPEESLVEIVEILSEKEVVLVDEIGEEIPLVSEEAAETLSSGDPYFDTGGGVFDGYTTPSGTCAPIVSSSGGTCHQSTTPVQDAVTAAPAGTNIFFEGTFFEQVLITKNLTLIGVAPGAGLSAGGLTLVQTGSSGAYSVYSLLTVSNALVNIRGLTIDGYGSSAPGLGQDYYAGIFYNNGSGTIEGNTIMDFNDPNSNDYGVGIFLFDSSYVTVEDNTIDNNEIGIRVEGPSSIENEKEKGIKITHNDITNSSFYGLQLFNINSGTYPYPVSDQSYITYNNIMDGSHGILVYRVYGNYFNPAWGVRINYNNILNNSGTYFSDYNLYLDRYTDARNNYWGTNNGEEISDRTDQLSYYEFSPWLSSPEPDAGPEDAVVICPAGQYNIGGVCLDCMAGTYSNAGATSCTPCAAGTYSGAGAASCFPCPAGSHSGVGASFCITCEPGYEWDAGSASCSICPAGTKEVDDVCVACPGGYVSDAGAIECNACGVGTFEENNVCVYCPAGTSNDQIGQAACTPCSPGSYSDSSGAVTCTPCPPGTANDQSGQTSCTPCAPGSFSGSPGAVTCTLCPAGTANDQTGQTACTPCAPGSFSGAPGALTCTLCPAGTANNQTGQAACTPCDDGYVSDVGATACSTCYPGTYESGNECILCPAGTANPLPAQTVCPACEPGTYTVGQGQVECSRCAPGSHTSKFGSTSCMLCKVGFYAANWGQAVCSACLPGHTSEPGAERCFYAGKGGGGGSGLILATDGELVKLPCDPECVILELPTGLQAEFCGLCGYSAALTEEFEETIPFDMPEGVAMVRGMTVSLFDEEGELVPEVPAVASLKFSYPLGDRSPKVTGIQLWDPAGEEWVSLINLLKPLGRLEAYVAWPGTSLLVE